MPALPRITDSLFRRVKAALHQKKPQQLVPFLHFTRQEKASCSVAELNRSLWGQHSHWEGSCFLSNLELTSWEMGLSASSLFFVQFESHCI